MMMDNALGVRAGSREPDPQAVPAVPASIPDAEWPCWAAVGMHEEWRNGARCTVTSFRWLFAPDQKAAQAGGERMMRESYPQGDDVEVFVREVPAQAIEARRAATGTGAVHESAVAKPCAQNTPGEPQ